MLKRKIIQDIYRKNRIVSRAVIRQIIDEYIEIQKIALLNEGKIYLGDMCILKLVDVQSRRYFNPSTGEYYIKPKRKRVVAVVRHSMNDALTKKYPPIMPKMAKSKKNYGKNLKKKARKELYTYDAKALHNLLLDGSYTGRVGKSAMENFIRHEYRYVYKDFGRDR